MKNKRVFFPNLDGLRFIAASMVIFPHIEQFKSFMGLDYSYSIYPYQSGKLGVVLFFVLSGYLITYLLLAEKNSSKNISIKKFYLRRILRIWPVYYLMIVLAIFVFPFLDILDYGGYTPENLSRRNVIQYFLFLPNVALFVPLIAQAWSVGVEEQFYIIWPVLIKYVKNKYFLFIGVISLYFILANGLVLFKGINFLTLIHDFIILFRIDCMAIGAFFALLLFEQKKILPILYSKYFQIFTYTILFVLLVSKVSIPFIHFQVFAILFGIIILNLSSNNKTIISLNGKVINHLGKISYGMYMYHPVVIILVLKTLIYFNISNVFIQYLFSMLLTIFISHISYNYYELFFIKMKDKFSVILSGKDPLTK
jgi:peptidoglycan/LPS O-acetylase OafA/YrhL